MIGAVLKLIIFASMVNRIINTSRNERVTQQIYDTYLQMFDLCTLRHTAHIEGIVQFLPYVGGSISFRPDIQRPRQMQNALRDI